MKIYSSRELERIESVLNRGQKDQRDLLLSKGYSPSEALFLIGVRNGEVPDFTTDEQHVIIRRHLRKTKNGRKVKVRKHKRRKAKFKKGSKQAKAFMKKLRDMKKN